MKGSQTRERGSSLVEQLVAIALVAVVLGVALTLLGGAQRVRSRQIAGADLVWTRAKAHAEIAAAESAAAMMAYFDLSATIAQARGTSTPAAAAGTSSGGTTPPAGYCGPVDPRDPATWPAGFDPRDASTWGAVTWWSGVDRRDPSTWYYKCPATTNRRLVPVYSYGTGVRFGVTGGSTGFGGNRPGTIVGPAAVFEEGQAIYPDQAGDALVMLKTRAGSGPIALGAPFASGSGVIRLVARDAADVARIEGLRDGDVLVVTGRVASGRHVTAIAEIRDGVRRVAVAGPASPTGGSSVFKYYEASVSRPDATFRWGLRNSEETAAGTVVDQDAAVALLDRDEGVVGFYTARENGGKTMTLYRVVGDPASPERREPLVQNALHAVSARLATTTVAGGPGVTDTIPMSLTVSMAVAWSGGDGAEAAGGGEPLNVQLQFLGAAQTNRYVGYVYGEFPTPVPLPEPGLIGGGTLPSE